MINRFKKWLHHMNYLPCHKCGSRKTDTKNYDYIDHMVCEYEVICAKCGSYINYWAYGNLAEPETYTELWLMKYASWRYTLRRIFKKDDLPF